MKNIISKIVVVALLLFVVSCENIVDGINENPNDILINEVDTKLFLTGGLLANIQIQLGHLNRIGGMYSGQLIGFSSLYSNIYGYNLSTAESNSEWNHLYVGVMTNMRHIVANTDNALLVGIAKIVEGHALGTSASLYGDIPYQEAVNIDISDPAFDPQIEVYKNAIGLLDDGITTLGGANSVGLSQDIYFNGDKDKWIAAAYTLKARFYLHMKDYENAQVAAQNGIGSADGDMKYQPRGEATTAEGDKNLFWTILEGSRAGDIGNASGGDESYLMQLLNPESSVSRNHVKTNEVARYDYYKINSSGGTVNKGIVEQFEPQNMVTYFENQLIKAECGARLGNLSDGLPHLNEVRSWLNNGGNINANFSESPFLYENFEAVDFDNGGIENLLGIAPKTAFLKEVIEERYVSGFGMHMPYNDARRLRERDQDIAVPFVLVLGPNPPYPERMPYPTNELNSNSNAPAEDPGIFTKTEVNK